MHCRYGLCGDLLCADEDEAIQAARQYLAYFPGNRRGDLPAEAPRGPAYGQPVAPLVPTDESQPFDVYPLVAAVLDEESFFEIKREFAAEVVCVSAGSRAGRRRRRQPADGQGGAVRRLGRQGGPLLAVRRLQPAAGVRPTCPGS